MRPYNFIKKKVKDMSILYLACSSAYKRNVTLVYDVERSDELC